MQDTERFDEDLRRLAEQELRLVLPRFDAADAWDLGCALRQAALDRGAALAIEIRLVGETVFFCAMPGTTPVNADWARRKRNTVERLHQSSYRVGRSLLREGTSLEQKLGLPGRDHASHGGSFPLRVAGVGVVGTVTVSGLPQREDHELIVQVLAARCGLDAAALSLAT